MEQNDKRLEDKVDEIKLQLTRLIALHEKDGEQAKAIFGKVETIETEMDKQRGALSLVKWFGGFALTGTLSFCVWIVQGSVNTNDRMGDTNQKVALLESRLSRNEADLNAITNDMKGYYDVSK